MKLILIKPINQNVTKFFDRISKNLCDFRTLMFIKNPNVTRYFLSFNNLFFLISSNRKINTIFKVIARRFGWKCHLKETIDNQTKNLLGTEMLFHQASAYS